MTANLSRNTVQIRKRHTPSIPIYKAYYNLDDTSNMFHLYSKYTIAGEGQLSIHSDDTYFYYDEYGVNMTTLHGYITDIYITLGNEPKWELSFQSYEEQRVNGLQKELDTFSLPDVLNGIHDLDYIENADNYEFTIPLIDTNFTVTMFPEIMLYMKQRYLVTGYGNEVITQMVQDRFEKITLSIYVSKD